MGGMLKTGVGSAHKSYFLSFLPPWHTSGERKTQEHRLGGGHARIINWAVLTKWASNQEIKLVAREKDSIKTSLSSLSFWKIEFGSDKKLHLSSVSVFSLQQEASPSLSCTFHTFPAGCSLDLPKQTNSFRKKELEFSILKRSRGVVKSFVFFF